MNSARDLDLAALARGFKGRRCLVVGDVMLDVFERGRAARLAPDAPAPVITDVREESSPGGAANVAANLAALGADVTLLSAVGEDPEGSKLLEGLRDTGVRTGDVLQAPGRATVVKRRLVADGATLARVDSGDTGPLDVDDFVEKAAALAADVGVVVVSDYSGGVVTQRVADALGAVGHECIILDSKDLLRLRWREGTLAAATPNHLEAQKALGLPIKANPVLVDAGAIGEGLRRALGAVALAVTLAEEGVAVADGSGVAHLKGRRVANPDVNGAGDTFLSAFALALGGGVEAWQAARLGVEAATLAVARPGTAPVGIRELLQRLPEDYGEPERRLEEDLARVRRSGGKVVFTNGCFDLLHRGHLFLLREARKLGDVLVVGVNSDASARRAKGPGRPVTPEEDRVELLEALPFVDHVLVFDGETPEALIEHVKPDLHVKGGDHAGERLVEEPVVRRLGGDIVVLPLLPGKSASATIEHIRSGADGVNAGAATNLTIGTHP